MTGDLVVRLLGAIDEKQRRYEELVRDPFDGLSDDELHQRHAHRAYEYATTEGQRKAWDDEMVPPAGVGWELNITSTDPEAWERFDYHEERYWRRMRPDGLCEWVPAQESVDGLRLCQSHRDIVAKYERTKQLLAEANQRVLVQVVNGQPSSRPEQRDFDSLHIEEAVYREVVEDLARGYGLEDQ